MTTQRPARPHRYEVPTRADVAARLAALATDPTPAARAAASDWAAEYLTYEDPQIYPEVRDDAVHQALADLTAADLLAAPGEYLHGPEAFAAWHASLAGAPPAQP